MDLQCLAGLVLVLAQAGDSPGDQRFPPGRRVRKREKSSIQEESTFHNKKKSFMLDAYSPLVHSVHGVSQVKVSSDTAGQLCVTYCKSNLL